MPDEARTITVTAHPPRGDGGDVDEPEEGAQVGPPAEAILGRDGGDEEPHRDLRREDQHRERLPREEREKRRR